MLNYTQDIQREARNFILNHKDMIERALADGADFDRNEIVDLDETFHTDITDRSYTLQDAAFILDECENEETDSGLWEGEEPREAISIMATYSFSNDVWFACEAIYNRLKEDIENWKEDDSIHEIEEIAHMIFNEWEAETTPQIVSDLQERIRLLTRWLQLNQQAGRWGDYPAGSSYIDARCGSGHGMPEVKEYVDFDHDIVRRIPEIRYKSRREVDEYLEILRQNENQNTIRKSDVC